MSQHAETPEYEYWVDFAAFASAPLSPRRSPVSGIASVIVNVTVSPRLTLACVRSPPASPFGVAICQA